MSTGSNNVDETPEPSDRVTNSGIPGLREPSVDLTSQEQTAAVAATPADNGYHPTADSTATSAWHAPASGQIDMEAPVAEDAAGVGSVVTHRPTPQAESLLPGEAPQGTAPEESSTSVAWKKPAIAGGILAAVGAAYIGVAALAAGTIPSEARIGATEVGGLDADAATQKVRGDIEKAAASPISLRAGANTTTIQASDAGLTVDVDASVNQLTSFSLNPVKIMSKFSDRLDVDYVTTADEGALRRTVEDAKTKLDSEPVNADVIVDGTTTRVEPGRDGMSVNVDDTLDVVKKKWASSGAEGVEVAAAATPPQVTTDNAKEVQNSFFVPALTGPLTLAVDGTEMKLATETLAPNLSTSVEDGTLTPKLNGEALRDTLLEQNDNVGVKAKDAKIIIQDGKPTVVPGVKGVTLDPSAVAEAVKSAVSTTERRAELATAVADPEFTTKDAEALDITAVMSEFTSKMPNNPVRTSNIALAARTINGTVLKPGETFSMNKVLGRRTAAKGYKSAPVIMGGRLTRDYGGGISQMATTLFNGMFFAGLDEVEHKPHSFYISRYPEGREATINYPTVDLKFTNDTPKGVLIQSWVSGNTVNTRFWGQNQYDDIKAVKSARSRVRNPKSIVDDSPGCVRQSPSPGFDVAVTRIFIKGGAEVKRETFKHRYIPEDKVECVSAAEKKRREDAKRPRPQPGAGEGGAGRPADPERGTEEVPAQPETPANPGGAPAGGEAPEGGGAPADG